VLAVAIAPDAGWLATADDDGTVMMWSEDGVPTEEIRVDGTISGLAWSPKGGDLYIAGTRRLYRFTLGAPSE
jgi:sugar lactone lactonase YvrE